MAEYEDARLEIAHNLFKRGLAGIRWHSLTCACDECLNADALCYLYNWSTADYAKPDITGLLASRVAH